MTYFFVTKTPQSNCTTALCNILDIPNAPGKTFALTTSLELMGMLLDYTKMEVCFPLNKLVMVKEALW